MTDRPILHHQVVGQDRGIGLLLLPPLGAKLDFWQSCMDIWRDRVACVAIDLRSYIATGGDKLPVTIDQHVEDLRHLQRHLGFERCVPVGCAVSSMIAAALAAAHPETTAALVLSNATPRSSPQARTMLSERGATVRRQGIAAILPQAVERAFLNQPHDERYRRYYDSFASQSAEDYAFACEASADYDAGSCLEAVRCPTLVIAGEHDVLLPPALSREVAAAVPGSRLHIMPNVAHFAPYQAPEVFAGLVDAFLKAHGLVS